MYRIINVNHFNIALKQGVCTYTKCHQLNRWMVRPKDDVVDNRLRARVVNNIWKLF